MEVETATENGAAKDIPEIELIIKASTIDGRRKGACLFCHEYFMDLYLLAELKTISLKITTVDMLKPPPDFRSNFEATPPPILIDDGNAILENEDIERHIMKNIPGGHNLFVRDKEVALLIENVYSKFKIMLNSPIQAKKEQAKANLLGNLQKINNHLESKEKRFLTGDTMCCFGMYEYVFQWSLNEKKLYLLKNRLVWVSDLLLDQIIYIDILPQIWKKNLRFPDYCWT